MWNYWASEKYAMGTARDAAAVDSAAAIYPSDECAQLLLLLLEEEEAS